MNSDHRINCIESKTSEFFFHISRIYLYFRIPHLNENTDRNLVTIQTRRRSIKHFYCLTYVYNQQQQSSSFKSDDVNKSIIAKTYLRSPLEIIPILAVEDDIDTPPVATREDSPMG